MNDQKKAIILLVEDNPADIRLMLEILKEGNIPTDFHVVTDGEEAIAFLKNEGAFARKPRPEIIFLDLNLPKKDGREVLREIKSDPALKRIPVIVMTTSGAKEDIESAYDHHANCFITKPVDLQDFMRVAETLRRFWLNMVQLPALILLITALILSPFSSAAATGLASPAGLSPSSEASFSATSAPTARLEGGEPLPGPSPMAPSLRHRGR